ncbi:hypothetical protein NUW58_g8743 [Xylaria curta]|uniref:Uncharacterized protein n=1 Tax=Xylaria curta TaxID=42375 RepID=A0ACC1N5P0_9PEZI|nr:hypothetical protein NUW58_g8743 [Xylaria curta]
MQRKTLPFLSVVFQRWMDAKEDVNREKMKLQIVGLHPTFSLPVKIKVLAEWDTVSAIGHVGLRKKFSFMKDKVPENVENAFLAIALNERRGSFKPMAYTKAHRGTNVAQCAFSGCHSDIGGGNIDAGLSTVSLLWMTAKVQDACQASLDRGVLLQMVQPPRPSKKWWYGWKTDETAALNLLWSKGVTDERSHLEHASAYFRQVTLAKVFRGGWRRRYFRKTFQRQGRNGRKEQDEQHEMTAQHIQRQVAHPAKLHAATYDYANPEDVIKRVSEDVMVKIREGINRAGEESKIEDTDLLSATVKTAIHVNNTKTEAKVTAMVDAAFATYSERGGAAAYWHRTKEARNPQLESGHQKNEIAPGDVDCKLRIHFTVKELVKEPRYRSKEGTLEGLSARLGWLGYERVQPGDYFSQECYNGSERRLWEEWKRQVDMWHTSNQGRKGGWDDDVMYWRDVLARFDKGKKPGSLAQKDMVRWESCANQLRRLADAAAATAQAGLRITAENVTEARADLEFMTRMVTMAVEVAEQLQDHEDITLQKLWSAINEAKEVFNRVSGSKMMGPSAFSLVDVTQTAAGADGNSGLDQKDSLEMDTQKDAQVAIRAVTGQLAGIAGLLAQTLSPFSPTFSPPTPLALSARATPPYIDGKNTDDGDYGWRVGILNAKDAADRMVESAKALQNGDRLDVAAWKTTKDYATRAKEAAEEAAKAIRDATIQWKVTDEQRSEALCYRIAYPDLESTIGSIRTCA